jgi:hypothetical protein
MLYGDVVYQGKDGNSSRKDWAARAELAKQPDNEAWRLDFYQVYLVRDANRTTTAMLISSRIPLPQRLDDAERRMSLVNQDILHILYFQDTAVKEIEKMSPNHISGLDDMPMAYPLEYFEGLDILLRSAATRISDCKDIRGYTHASRI